MATQLPNTESVKLTITIPVVLKGQLERYAELDAAEHGRSADLGVFVGGDLGSLHLSPDAIFVTGVSVT